MSKLAKASLIPFIGLVGALLIFIAFVPRLVGAAGACGLSAGQVVINEVLPAPSDGVEWVELYNTTGGSLDIGNCYLSR